MSLTSRPRCVMPSRAKGPFQVQPLISDFSFPGTLALYQLSCLRYSVRSAQNELNYQMEIYVFNNIFTYTYIYENSHYIIKRCLYEGVPQLLEFRRLMSSDLI